MTIYLYHLFQEQVDIIQVRTLGNLDVDGFPFYKKDVAEGRLTPEHAEELLQFFYEAYTNQGHLYAQPLYFGGFDENGDSLINEFSYLMLTAYDRSCIVNPKLFSKVMPNTPDAFLKKALDMIRRGNNCIVFINEELGCKISRKLGRTEEETRRLVGTGCNNFASRGKETTPEHVYVNLAKGIELVFGNGRDLQTGALIGVETGDVAKMKTFEDFKAAYVKQTECLINKAFVISDFYDSHLLDINPAPIYSASMPDSVKCGRDAYHNGVKYNNTVMFLSCHATAADSLMMVKKHVYDLKNVTVTELRDALLANWMGHEELRELLRNDPEKFGNNIDSVDRLTC
jgi:formate C-acetyltransferase